MLGGAEVVNAKAADAWFTVDLRSTSNEVLADLEKQIQDDSRRRSRARRDDSEDRRDLNITGGIDSRSPRVLSGAHVRSRASRDGIRSADHKRRLEQFQSGSARRHLFDLNRRRPVRSDAHALTENCEIEPLYKGIKKILLLELALAGVQ